MIDYPEYWPFVVRKGDGEMAGFFHDIVTEALGRMGHTALWRSYPWSRCQDNVRSGRSEAMITVPTDERLRYTATHDTPFYHKTLKVFTYADHPKLGYIMRMKTLDDVKAAGLSVITYEGNGWNDKHVRSRGIKVYETNQLKNVWRMLAKKRGDIVIEWPGAAWPDIVTVGVTEDVVLTPVSIEAMPFHLLINKDSPQAKILPDFDRIIQEMKADGTIERLVNRYIHQFE